MKLRYISLAVAAVLAAGGNYAAAATQNIWAAGSSSSTRAQYGAFASNCTAGGITIYMSGTSSSITLTSRPGDTSTGNYFRYTCVIHGAKTSTFNTWDGDTVNMYHTVHDGSFVAFQPHLPVPTPTKRITSALTGCTLVGTSAGVTVHKSCATTTASNSSRPDGGFSDLEDELWNQGVNFAHKSAHVAQMFGVVVTDALYLAMQAKEIDDGITGGTPIISTYIADGIPMNPNCYGDFTPGECQPNITHDQYRSIISLGCGTCAYQTDWNPLVDKGSTPSVYEGNGKVVRVCRRVDTSGTQASSNAYFLENPCRQWFVAPGQQFPTSNLDDAVGLYDVVENSGTGDVKACLTNSNNLVSKTNASNGAAGNYASTAATNFAIGVISAENIVSSTDKWKYIKLDGASPNIDAKQRAAGAQGKYGFVMEMAYFAVPQAGIGSASKPSTLNPTTNIEGFFDELANDMADETLNLAGLFISPTRNPPPTYDGDKVGSGAKFGNNCQPQQLFF